MGLSLNTTKGKGIKVAHAVSRNEYGGVEMKVFLSLLDVTYVAG